MYKIEIGDKIQKFKGANDGVKFDMADDGATLLLLFKTPSQKEIEQVKTGKLQFGMYIKEGVMFILSKFGSMPWMDAPYHVRLSKNLTTLDEVEDGEGYGCMITLIDTTTGEVKALRYIGFSTEYSRRLKQSIKAQGKEDFNEIEYSNKLNTIFRNYSIKDMVKYSEVNCRVK